MIRFPLLAAALIASGPALAQTAKSPAAKPQAQAPASMPRAKVVANAEAEFARVDTNKDGQMSRTEIETFQRAAATAARTRRNAAVFAALDADKNGQVSAAEFAKINSAPIQVDASEVLKVDTNKDGQISLAEHRGATLDTFTLFDANKDGTLTKAEVEAQAAKSR